MPELSALEEQVQQLINLSQSRDELTSTDALDPSGKYEIGLARQILAVSLIRDGNRDPKTTIQPSASNPDRIVDSESPAKYWSARAYRRAFSFSASPTDMNLVNDLGSLRKSYKELNGKNQSGDLSL